MRVSMHSCHPKATLKVDVQRVFEQTIPQKPETTELVVTMTLVRRDPTSRWVIEKADYVPKPT